MSYPKDKARAHIVFDNDGTMINSLENFYDLIDQVLPIHMGRAVTKEEVMKAYVPDWHQLFINLGVEKPSESFIQGVIDDLNELNCDYIPPIVPGTIEFIKRLHDLEMATYVWTGRDQHSGMKVFNGLGLTPLFHDMQFRDTSKAKPHPEGLELMLGDIDKRKIVLIGDSEVDIKGAQAFGIPCVIVDWFGHCHHESLHAEGAEHIFNCHDKLLSWLIDHLS
ncbi:MAG: HAD-IA family hydrolase [Bacteriovoracaceae bacterium]|nr:HAD-IA family hydrolase [Bacteriovoracaceae bacterium]